MACLETRPQSHRPTPRGMSRRSIMAARRGTSARRRVGDGDGCVGAYLDAVLCPAGVERPIDVSPPIGVGAEVVAQSLDQVGRAAGAAVAVVVSQRAGERGDRDALLR